MAGGNGTHPTGFCASQDDRIETVEVWQRQHEIEHNRANQRNTEQLIAMFSEIKKVGTKVDRLLEGIKIGAVVPAQTPEARQPLPSIGWDLNEPTYPGNEDESARLWKGRAGMAIEAKTAAEVELIRERAKARKALIAAVCTGIATVIAAAAALIPLLK